MCEERRIVLVRFDTSFVTTDLAALDRLAAASPGAGPLDCIFDLTEVKTFDLKPEFVTRRGEIPQAYRDRQRFYVVAQEQEDLRLLVRFYAAYQANGGWRPPEIVPTLHETLAMLGVDRSSFRPLPLPGLVPGSAGE